MQLLIIGLVIFFVTHVYTAFRSREPGRDLKQKLGLAPIWDSTAWPLSQVWR